MDIMTGMEIGRGEESPFLAIHGYFVSTSSDEEDEDENYWREEGWEGHRCTIGDMWAPQIYERRASRWADFERHHHQDIGMYLSELQLQKSRACSAASKYSLQRSHELLMGRISIQEADASKKKSVEMVVMANAANLEGDQANYGAVSDQMRTPEDVIGNDYPDPIDIDSYCNQPRGASSHEDENLKRKGNHNNQNHKQITSSPLSSGLMSYGSEGETRPAGTDACNSLDDLTQQQRKYKTLTRNPAVFSFGKTSCDERDDITSQKPKQQVSRQFRSFRRSQEHGSKYPSTSVHRPQLRRGNPLKTYGPLSERSCSGRFGEHACDFLQICHDSNRDDQFTCHKTENKVQDTDPVSTTMRRKHIGTLYRRGDSKRQYQEADDEKGGTRVESEQALSLITSPRVQNNRGDPRTLARTEEDCIHGGLLRTPGISQQGVHWDQRNALKVSQSPVETIQASIQREVSNRKDKELGFMDTSNAPDFITPPERGHSVTTEIRNSKLVKHGAPSTQNANLEQLLPDMKQLLPARRFRRNSTQSTASENNANEDGKSLNAESPHTKCLRERQLQTLNVIYCQTPETDGKTIYRQMNRTEGSHRPGIDETYKRKSMTSSKVPSSDAMSSEGSRTTVTTRKRKDGAIFEPLVDEENINHTENTCIPLLKKESVGNRKLPAPSTIKEEPRLQLSVYSPGKEETNVEVRDQSKEPGQFVDSKSREVMEVDLKAPEQYAELALQSNRLLMLLRDLHVQETGNYYGNTSIISAKTVGTTDAAPERGYLAQYLKTKKFGTRGTRRLLNNPQMTKMSLSNQDSSIYTKIN